MNEQQIISVKNDYDTFRNKLTNKIKDKNILMNNIECYLIKEDWISKLSKVYNEQGSNQKYKRYKSRYTTEINSTVSLPDKNEDFLNDFSSLIECLKTKKRFKLINRESIEQIFNNNYELRAINFIYYYTGNNKIIIEFKGRNEKYALLFIDPLRNYNKIFLISKTNKERENKQLYQKIIEKFSPYLSENKEFKQYIISYEDYIKNKNTSNPIKEDDTKQKKEIYDINRRYYKREQKEEIKNPESKEEPKQNDNIYSKRVNSNYLNEKLNYNNISNSNSTSRISYSNRYRKFGNINSSVGNKRNQNAPYNNTTFSDEKKKVFCKQIHMSK